MSTRILLIAHAPLAQALAQCAAHVFPDSGEHVLAFDVAASADPVTALEDAQALLRPCGSQPVLVLSDVFGATPHNIAQALAKEISSAVLVVRSSSPVAQLLHQLDLPRLQQQSSQAFDSLNDVQLAFRLP